MKIVVIVALAILLIAIIAYKRQKQDKITFREVVENDTELIYSWLQEQHISTWWPTPAKDIFLRDWFKSLRPKGAFPYLVLVNQKPIGLIQYYSAEGEANAWLPKLPPSTLGIDQFIGDKHYLGKGYGVRLIKEFIQYLKTIEPSMAAVIVDPDPKNIVAINCYEKVGFKKIGEYAAPWGPALVMVYKVYPAP